MTNICVLANMNRQSNVHRINSIPEALAGSFLRRARAWEGNMDETASPLNILLAHNSAVKEQHQRFQQGLPVDENVVTPMLLTSWTRCRAAAVNSGTRPEAACAALLKKAMRASREMLESATATMEKLFFSISAAHSLIALADADGLILHTVGRNEDIIRLEALSCGRYATESEVGTNGLGTCLVERRPLEIIGYEHYIPMAQEWCCSAAPIFDSKGRLAGVINVSIALENYHHHTLGMVEAAAHAIMEQLRLRTLLNEQQTMLELIDEGVLILDAGGIIGSMNNRARRMLQVAGDGVGSNIRDIVKSSDVLDSMLNARPNLNDQETLLQLRSGQLWCTLSSAPVKEGGGLILTLREARRMREYATRTVGAKAVYTFENIIGEAPAFQESIRLARIATQSDITTLILGESGTGKELFAQAIHNASARRNAPFVVVNCGALPRTLVESELFGYEEGAFTGASRSGKPGKFELADRGTIFLDEIGEMPLDAQTSLLRLLQEGELTRVGGRDIRRVNIRVIAATNRNLTEAVRQKAFREDLFYRLNVLTLVVPPLRDRLSDIRALAQHFLHKFARSLSKPVTGFSTEAFLAMTRYQWPGNVRELENIVERTINITESSVIQPADLPDHILESVRPAVPETPLAQGAGTLRDREAEVILASLRNTRGNMRAAAQQLGIARSALYRKVERLGISPNLWREDKEPQKQPMDL